MKKRDYQTLHKLKQRNSCCITGLRVLVTVGSSIMDITHTIKWLW